MFHRRQELGDPRSWVVSQRAAGYFSKRIRFEQVTGLQDPDQASLLAPSRSSATWKAYWAKPPAEHKQRTDRDTSFSGKPQKPRSCSSPPRW